MSAPITITVRELIQRAYYNNGALAPGDSLSPTDGPVALGELQALIDLFGVDRLFIYLVQQQTFDLIANQQQYTIGEDGDFDVTRPIWIDRAVLVDTSVDPPYDVTDIGIMDTDAWASVSLKTLTSTWPTAIYYDYSFDSDGLGLIRLWPVPTQTLLQLRLYLPTPMTNVSSLNDTIKLPPGYLEFFVKNLAVRTAVIMGRPVDPTLLYQAQQAEGLVKRANVRPMDIRVDAAWLAPLKGGAFNWRTGEPS